MSRVAPHLRNIVIILAIAAVVAVVPGGGTGARVAVQAISLLFLGLLAWIATRLYREHRTTLYSLGDGRRALLYAAAGAAAVVLSATALMLNTGVGTIAWVVVLGACVYVVFAVAWASRQY